MNLVIHQATEKDAALIADLSRQTFTETFAAQNTAENMEKFLREQFSCDMLMAEVGAPGNTFFIASASNKPAGYARLHESQADAHFNKIEIARLYATAAMIGKGVGKALMQACIQFAQEQGKQRVYLGVWEKNYRAQQFYTAWGFEKVGGHDFRLGNDIQHDWVMEKNLY